MTHSGSGRVSPLACAVELLSAAAKAAAAPRVATVATRELLDCDLDEDDSVRWVSVERTRENAEAKPRANMIEKDGRWRWDVRLSDVI